MVCKSFLTWFRSSMKSIVFRCDRQHSPSGIANSLSLIPGEQRLNGNLLTIPLTAIDDALVAALQGTTPLDDTPQPSSTQVEPQRITRTIPLPDAAKLQLLQLKASLIADSAEEGRRSFAYQDFQEGCRLLRNSIVAEAAKEDCDQPPTLVYGARLEGATAIVPDTRPRQCHTLIHCSNPETPEDLHLRELNIRCDRIIRYRVEELDSAAWSRQNEPLRWPLDAEDFRGLAYARITAMLC